MNAVVLHREASVKQAEEESRYFLQYISVILIVLCFTVYTVINKNITKTMIMTDDREAPLQWMPSSEAFQKNSEEELVWSGAVRFNELHARTFLQTKEFLALSDLFHSHDLQFNVTVELHASRVQDPKKSKQLTRFVSELRRALLNRKIPGQAYSLEINIVAKEQEELLKFAVSPLNKTSMKGGL